MIFLLALLMGPPAMAGVSEGAYGAAVRLIDRLYLHPDDVDEGTLLRAAAVGLSDELDWLIVEGTGATVSLRYGDGTPIGTLSVGSMETLPAALAGLEEMVLRSGHDVGDVDVRLSLLSGLTGALDRYSRVMAGERLDRFNKRLKGVFVGVGATLWLENDVLVVGALVTGGPAELGGLRVGDQLVRIDGRSTVNMPASEATRRLAGEEDTQVHLEVRRRGVAEPEELVLTRAQVIEPNVIHDTLTGNVGYIAITHVSQKTVYNLVNALESLKAKDALSRGLVIDLRGNTGGSMKESARSADEFVTEGLLLRTVGPDGGRVQNLQAEMSAVVGGHEPDMPIVILVDERTASGSEIMAGALLELDRAALVGTRTYGKGTVQKIYNLDDDTRLKLTVAQYLLANGRAIAGVGIVPDTVVGEVELDSYGVRFRDWDERVQRTPWDEIVPDVHETFGWRGESSPNVDLALEIARRAVIGASGSHRKDVLASLQRVTEDIKIEQEGLLVSALEHHDINWSPAEAPLGPIEATVRMVAKPAEGRSQVIAVEVEVENTGDTLLSRALVELECDTFSLWSGRIIPVGGIEPGQIGTGRVLVPLPPGIEAREDIVRIRLRADKREPLLVGDEILQATSQPVPRIEVEAALVRHEQSHQVVVTVHNLASYPITGVEVHFGFPGDVDVELLDQAVRVPVIGAQASETLTLGIQIGAEGPAALPLELNVESDHYRRLVSWPLLLPADGSKVRLEAPQIVFPGRPLAAPVGVFQVPITVSDDTSIDHVVVYANGDKVGWAPGGRSRLDFSANVDLLLGVNRLVVVAEDAQGISERRQFVVRGEAPAAVDAGD